MLRIMDERGAVVAAQDDEGRIHGAAPRALAWLRDGVPGLAPKKLEKGIREERVVVTPTDPLYNLALAEACDNAGWTLEDGDGMAKSLSKGKHFKDEDLAQKAHARVVEQYGLSEKDGERYWKLKTSIYQQMGGSFEKSQADEAADLLRSATPYPHSAAPQNDNSGHVAPPPLPTPLPVSKPPTMPKASAPPKSPAKRFPPPKPDLPQPTPRKPMASSPDLTKAQRHEADALLKAAGVEPAEVKPKRKASGAVAKATKDVSKIHERMQKLHTKAADEAANRGDGAASKLHADAAAAHTAAAHAHGAGVVGADALSDKAKAATQATLPQPTEGKGNAKQTTSAQAEAQGKVASGEVTEKPNAGAHSAGVGGRSKEGLKVVAIGPKGGKIVGYTTKDGKQKAIYEGSKAASKLAATVATHAPEPAKPEAAAPDGKPSAGADAAPAPAGGDAPASGEKGAAGKGGDYHRAKQAEHDKAAEAAATSGDTAGAEKHKDASRAHWAASLQNDKGTQGDDAASASEWADEKSAKADAGPATEDGGAHGGTPAAPAAPSEPIDDKPLSSDAPAGGTPADAPAPEELGSASPKTDSPESRHAEELAKMRGQVEEAHRKLEALAHHIDTNLVPMFNNLKAQARAAHKNPSKSAVGWLLSQIGRFASFVLGLHEDKGKVSSAADAIKGEADDTPGNSQAERDARSAGANGQPLREGATDAEKKAHAEGKAYAKKNAKPAKRPRMKSGKQASDYMQKSLTASSAEGACVEVLVTLQAIERLHHAAHLQAKGPESYADHLLFQRLYTDVQHEIDGLSEKMVAAFGGACVDADARGADAAELLADWSENDDVLQRALDAEMQLQYAIEDALGGEVSAGLENFLQGLADSHEAAIYLLQQRIKPADLVRAIQRSQADDLLKSARALG